MNKDGRPSNSSRTKLPNGKIGTQLICDPNVRDAIMKLSENIAALEKRIIALETGTATTG